MFLALDLSLFLSLYMFLSFSFNMSLSSLNISLSFSLNIFLLFSLNISPLFISISPSLSLSLSQSLPFSPPSLSLKFPSLPYRDTLDTYWNKTWQRRVFASSMYWHPNYAFYIESMVVSDFLAETPGKRSVGGKRTTYARNRWNIIVINIIRVTCVSSPVLHK